MSDRPIIFSAPMIRALIDGRKTQTRRVLKPQPPERVSCFEPHPSFPNELIPWRDGEPLHSHVVPYAPGDRLWVREAWGLNHYKYERGPIPKKRPRELDAAHFVYFGTETDAEILHEMRRRPSIHMPRWFSRLTLAVTGVKVERLQEISEADAIAEGMQEPSLRHLGGDMAQAAWSERQVFARLWNHLHSADAWDANPWVVAITFTVHRRNIDAMERAA